MTTQHEAWLASTPAPIGSPTRLTQPRGWRVVCECGYRSPDRLLKREAIWYAIQHNPDMAQRFTKRMGGTK